MSHIFTHEHFALEKTGMIASFLTLYAPLDAHCPETLKRGTLSPQIVYEANKRQLLSKLQNFDAPELEGERENYLQALEKAGSKQKFMLKLSFGHTFEPKYSLSIIQDTPKYQHRTKSERVRISSSKRLAKSSKKKDVRSKPSPAFSPTATIKQRAFVPVIVSR